jgi:hypothetical protein
MDRTLIFHRHELGPSEGLSSIGECALNDPISVVLAIFDEQLLPGI